MRKILFLSLACLMTLCTMHSGKYIHKGRFVFVKDGKMYNALGM